MYDRAKDSVCVEILREEELALVVDVSEDSEKSNDVTEDSSDELIFVLFDGVDDRKLSIKEDGYDTYENKRLV